MSRVAVAVPPQHEVLSVSEEGPPQQEASVGGAAAPRVSAIVPYRARTAVRISSWVSVSIPFSPLVVTTCGTSLDTWHMLLTPVGAASQRRARPPTRSRSAAAPRTRSAGWGDSGAAVSPVATSRRRAIPRVCSRQLHRRPRAESPGLHADPHWRDWGG